MNWQYSQSTGQMTGAQTMQGYSGAQPDGYNNPAMQEVENVGPLPRGIYYPGTSFECTATLQAGEVCPDCQGVGHHKHGPNVIRLTPDARNQMFGRSGMLCHGDEIDNPGHASEGCLIFSFMDRLVLIRSQQPIEVVE